jgi:hypothetical protein
MEPPPGPAWPSTDAASEFETDVVGQIFGRVLARGIPSSLAARRETLMSASGSAPSRLLKKSERAVKNHEQIGIKTGPFMNQSAATLSFSTAC